MRIKKAYKGLKKFGKKTVTRVKAIPAHPYYRATEDAILGGYKQALDDSKKISRGDFISGKPSKKSKAIRGVIWRSNL